MKNNNSNIFQYFVWIYFLVNMPLIGQTADQIKKAKEYIRRTGMSESQVRSEAKSRGFSDEQIDKAIKKEKSTDTGIKTNNSIDIQEAKEFEVGKSNELIQKEIKVESSDNVIINEELEKNGLSIINENDIFGINQIGRDLSFYGYDIFQRDPALFQASTVGVVDPDYLIGPGDEIIVMLWGETEFRQVLNVDREGFVFIPEIGQVFVNGLNLNLLESKLFRVFSQSYASLNPDNRKPTTFLDVSIGNLRPLRIQVLGEVAQPGAFTVNPSATLFSSLYYFNGPTTLGSLRDIQLIRGGEKIESIDFYDYLLTGKKPRDQKLQLDDVVFIPGRIKTIWIEGEVNRPGIYELKSSEGLVDLIDFAGELSMEAYLNRCQIDRIVPFQDRKQLGMDRIYIDVDLEKVINSKDNIKLYDGDRIQIFSIFDNRQNVVDIRGAVSRPGSYDLGDSLKLSQLIEKADGLLGDAFMDRIDIVRTRSNFNEELIKLNLSDVLKENSSDDIFLKGTDRVNVYSLTEMVPKKYVSIDGHVKKPGRYLLIENMTLFDLLFKSGGFVDEEFKKLTYLKRAELIRIKENNNEKEIIPFSLISVLNHKGLAKMKLFPNDKVIVYSLNEIEGEAGFVTLSGFVKKPGKYELYKDNMTIYDLLFKAGGFEDQSHKNKSNLLRADLIRVEQNGIDQKIIPFNLGDILENEKSSQNYSLRNDDEIRIYPLSMFASESKVTISGEVRNPGTYKLKNNMSLNDLIFESGGVVNDIYRYRIEVARLNPNNNDLEQYAKIINLNVGDAIKSNSPTNELNNLDTFLLKPHDLIYLRPDPYFTLQKKILITGEVLYPGEYTILSSKEKITDIIDRAGGLLANAYPEASEYVRKGSRINISLIKIMKRNKSSLNFDVQDGDHLIIKPRPNIVVLEGEVNNPGAHKYVPNRRLNYYIKIAGGLNPDADKNNIWINYPNGDSRKLYRRMFLSPIVFDGSTITVGKAKEEEPFNRTEYAKELTSIIANLSQALAVLLLARN